jgi:hypothetical protein
MLGVQGAQQYADAIIKKIYDEKLLQQKFGKIKDPTTENVLQGTYVLTNIKELSRYFDTSKQYISSYNGLIKII